MATTANIIDAMSTSFGREFGAGASSYLGEPTGATTGAINTVIPALLGSLANKASTTSGATDLLTILAAPTIDTRMLGNVSGLFQSGDRANALVSQGAPLASRLLGGERVDDLATAVSEKTGVKPTSARNLLAMMVPLGLIAAFSGSIFGSVLQSRVVVIGMALLFLAMAASMLGAFEMALPSGLTNRLATVGGAGYRGAFLLGLVCALIATPCTGPVLTGILTWIANTRSMPVSAPSVYSVARTGSVSPGDAITRSVAAIWLPPSARTVKRRSALPITPPGSRTTQRIR